MSASSTVARLATCACLCLVVAACQRPVPKKAPIPPDASAAPVLEEPSPEAAKWNWIASTRDGHLSVVQTARTPKVCEVECLRDPGQERLWKETACMGMRDQTRLVSDDGQWMLAIEAAPLEQGSWRAAVVATAYQRGLPKAQLLASDIFADDSKLVRFPESFQWLTGGRKLPVPAPKFVDGAPDQVELQLIDGRKAVVRLDGTLVVGARPVPPAPKPTPKPKVKPKTHR